jgi:hypothetical protein
MRTVVAKEVADALVRHGSEADALVAADDEVIAGARGSAV